MFILQLCIFQDSDSHLQNLVTCTWTWGRLKEVIQFSRVRSVSHCMAQMLRLLMVQWPLLSHQAEDVFLNSSFRFGTCYCCRAWPCFLRENSSLIEDKCWGSICHVLNIVRVFKRRLWRRCMQTSSLGASVGLGRTKLMSWQKRKGQNIGISMERDKMVSPFMDELEELERDAVGDKKSM